MPQNNRNDGDCGSTTDLVCGCVLRIEITSEATTSCMIELMTVGHFEC